MAAVDHPEVEVVYVTPMEVTDEEEEYFRQLVEMQGQEGAWDRVHLIVPEHLNSFPHNSFSLASLLKYSPHSLKRLATLTSGKDAYLVPHVVGEDDLELADVLGKVCDDVMFYLGNCVVGIQELGEATHALYTFNFYFPCA